MNKVQRIYENIVTGVLFSSSTVTSLTVILIIVFLFREGIGLFNSTPTEKNYVNRGKQAEPCSGNYIQPVS